MRLGRFAVVVLAAPALVSTHATAQEFAKKRLEQSPRHHEWVAVKRGDRAIHCFLAFPEVDGKVPAVVVIHENRGLTEWVRSVADKLAEAGYVAIAPDLLSGAAPGGGKTDDFPDSDAARQAIYRLSPEQVTSDLRAVADHAAKLPACNGKIAVAGFCWGGSQSFRFATNRSDLAAAFVFYGTGPTDEDAIARIRCPVFGFYGGRDARVTATVAKTSEQMEKAGKTFEPVTYEGAGHGFLRVGDGPEAEGANKKAHSEAWKRWKDLLKRN